jgi:dienelactone hydrolase
LSTHSHTGQNQNRPNGSNSQLPKPSPLGITCPGLSDCTAWNNSLPNQFHVAFPGPDNMTLHGHNYVPGVNTEAQFAALTKSTNSTLQQPSANPPAPLTKHYPAVIYNHGSELNPHGNPSLAKFYVEQGYVFFAPDRHGQGLSKDAGPYILDLEHESKTGQDHVDLHELYNKDVIAAVDWLKQQPYIDKQHLIMTGLSYGGIQTLLTAERERANLVGPPVPPYISAYLPFTPGAESWGNPALRQRLIDAVTVEKAPMFLLQAEGDYSTGPVETLGPILALKGDPKLWKAKLYPKFGCTNQDAHSRFASSCDGIAIWSPDALQFFDDVFKQTPNPGVSR